MKTYKVKETYDGFTTTATVSVSADGTMYYVDPYTGNAYGKVNTQETIDKVHALMEAE